MLEKGDRWFKFEGVKRLNLEPENTYLKRFLKDVYPGITTKKNGFKFWNKKKARFSCNELGVLSKKSCN